MYHRWVIPAGTSPCRTRCRRRCSRARSTCSCTSSSRRRSTSGRCRSSRIVDAFCAEVERFERLDLEVATEFLLIAATLVELKARRLLPGRDDIELDEELWRFEERDLLLAAPARVQDVQGRGAGAARAAARSGAAASPRTAGPEEPFRSLAPDPLERLPLDKLAGGRRRGLAPKPAARSTPTTSRRSARASATRSRRCSRCLPDQGPIRLPRALVGVDAKLEVIVRFLAVLELYKQGLVDIEQVENFGELVVGPLAPGERVALDLSSLDEWGDDRGPTLATATTSSRGARVSDTEARRAIEAHGARGDRARRTPTVLAQLLEVPVDEIDASAPSSRPSTRRRAAASSSRGRGRLPLPDPPRPRAYVERFVLEGQTARLSGPALETLAIVAYKQPVPGRRSPRSGASTSTPR